ncbi:MAG: sugar nucleotide-binding protein [Candidatus Moraniibacteriota bacterium]
MKAAIIGTGFLGEQIYEDIKSSCERVILTHNRNKKYPDSVAFDFFSDDIMQILGDKKTDIIFLPAKIEFIDDSKKLIDSMTEFLENAKGSRIVYISSDGIFDGQKGLYNEDDELNPVTKYGNNLKSCEELVRKKADSYCIVRPSYLYGFVNGKLDSRFRKLKEEIEEGKEVRRFNDMYKSPLSYKQASEAIVKIAKSDFNGIMNVSGERKSVYDFTKEGLESLGVSTEGLIEEPIPKDRPIDFLPDTSLNFSRMENLTGVHPISIRESFEKFGWQYVDKNAFSNKYLR